MAIILDHPDHGVTHLLVDIVRQFAGYAVSCLCAVLIPESKGIDLQALVGGINANRQGCPEVLGGPHQVELVGSSKEQPRVVSFCPLVVLDGISSDVLDDLGVAIDPCDPLVIGKFVMSPAVGKVDRQPLCPDISHRNTVAEQKESLDIIRALLVEEVGGVVPTATEVQTHR